MRPHRYAESHAYPDDSDYDHICDEYDCERLPSWESMPGNIMGTMEGTRTPASHTTRIEDGDYNYNNGWMVTAHQATVCRPYGTLYHQWTDQDGNDQKMGEVVEFYPHYDVAIVENTEGIENVSEVADPTDVRRGGRYPIESTMTQDGVDFWRSTERNTFRMGAGSCDSGHGQVQYRGDTTRGTQCSDEIQEVITYQYDEPSSDGDSGSLHFGYYDEQDTWLALGIHTGGYTNERIILPDEYFQYGCAGYELRNELSYWWQDAF